MLKKRWPTFCLLLSLDLLSACAQWWEVRPYPDFVNADISTGDQLRIETRDGERSKLVVAEVQDDRIVGENQTILLQDIVRLEKRSNLRPDHRTD